MKVRREMIEEEYRDEDGYWIALRPGWKAASDPLGAVHEIHEDTKREAHEVGVLPCDCPDCRRDR